MDLSNLVPPRAQGRLIDHLLIWGAAGLTLGVFAVAEDRWKGRAEVTDGLAFSVIFLVTGYVQGWLPGVWRLTERTPFAGLVTPLFMTLALAYLYFALRAAFTQPTATGIGVLAQLIALIVLTGRNP